MPKIASSRNESPGRGRGVHHPLGLQERLAPNGENTDAKAIAADARAARRLKREVERDGLVESEDATSYWVALQAETATARQLKEANEKLEKKLAKAKRAMAQLQLTVNQSAIKISAYEEMLQAKETELNGTKELLGVAEARADRSHREKMAYWEELSSSLRMVEILQNALSVVPGPCFVYTRLHLGTIRAVTLALRCAHLQVTSSMMSKPSAQGSENEAGLNDALVRERGSNRR
ncbi:hypothetical protein FA13DRAFT_1710960 [Coprinellus micaceus]|uniref:Uncharacterized protein n=1 Tax=Coprinellus micaceus TaxID=71717 RepID=A0A4Y7T714_COPMI|nr:hypothetical protein FA13DRAFT_1710960 [Coprinellus micaceus]